MQTPTVTNDQQLHVEATTPLPTRYGTLRMMVFRHGSDPDKEHVAMVAGDPSGGHDVLVRLHSECMTSEVFGSLKCDCREQLEAALAQIARTGTGVVLYLRQEGRGIGLANKVRAYALQALGADTVDANRLLGLPDDLREYGQAAAMLRALGVQSVRLMTNNPTKVTGLRAYGIEVRGREPVVIAANPHSRGYLDAKRDRMNHALPSALPFDCADAAE